MAKEGEIDYLRRLGDAGRQHAADKPFSDVDCHVYLEDMAAILALLPRPPARLLDIGCGTGWTSSFFARRGYDVVGVDIAQDMIALANQLRDAAGLSNLTFATLDYEHMDFRDQFDIAVFFDSLHHAVDERLAMRRAFEALKPGGMCVTREPGAGHAATPGAIETVRKYDVTEKDMPASRVIALAREAGFRRFYVFPLPQDNRLIAYRLEDAAGVSGEASGLRPGMRDPLEHASWVKRLFHGVFRRRFQFSRTGYSMFLASLAQVRAACERQDWHVLSSVSALTVLIK